MQVDTDDYFKLKLLIGFLNAIVILYHYSLIILYTETDLQLATKILLIILEFFEVFLGRIRFSFYFFFLIKNYNCNDLSHFS